MTSLSPILTWPAPWASGAAVGAFLELVGLQVAARVAERVLVLLDVVQAERHHRDAGHVGLQEGAGRPLAEGAVAVLARGDVGDGLRELVLVGRADVLGR